MQKQKENLSRCHCMNLRRAANKATTVYDTYLKPSGLSISQFSLLSHIKQLSPVSVSNLAKTMGLDRTTLVRNLKQLEKSEYIHDVSKGGRERQLQLTETGTHIYNKAFENWQEAQTYFKQIINEDQMEAFENFLEKIILMEV